MIHIIKRYWKYVLGFFICVMLFCGTYFYNKKVEVQTDNEIKLSSEIKKEEEKISSNKTLFVDVKGAVNAPGVYELDVNSRVIDAIAKAGGLADNANTINLNLSKKLEDEMYIIVYTKNEILNYKKNSDSSNIVCASKECICPDSNNSACIKQSASKNSSETKTVGKISINNASKDELMTLSGIGESKADAIIKYRLENGNFNSLEDIKNVTGIGDSVYEKIKDNITL